MLKTSSTATESKGMLWSGRIIGGLVTLLLLLDAVGKFAKPQPVLDGTVQLGYKETVIIPLGVVLLACTLLYAVPRTAVLGAVLLTGYLGGAVASQARIEAPLFSHVLFPVYMGVLVWLGLYLRDGRLRVLLPMRA